MYNRFYYSKKINQHTMQWCTSQKYSIIEVLKDGFPISYNTLLTFWVQRFIWVHLEQLTRTSQIPHLHVMHRNHCKIHQEHYVVNGAAPVALTHSETCVVLSSSLIFHLCQWNCKHFHISIAPWISVTFPLIHNLEWKKRRIEAVHMTFVQIELGVKNVCFTWCDHCSMNLCYSFLIYFITLMVWILS